MKFSGVKDVAELVGIAAIVGSLMFVGMELRQQQRMAQNEARFALVENGREIRNAIIENAELWLRGNAGEDLDRIESEIYAELIRMRWARAYWTATSFEGLADTPDVSLHDFAVFLHRNPGARRVWETDMAVEQDSRARFYSEPPGADLANVVLSDLEMLDEEPED